MISPNQMTAEETHPLRSDYHQHHLRLKLALEKVGTLFHLILKYSVI
jgi:hypothetical protein